MSVEWVCLDKYMREHGERINGIAEAIAGGLEDQNSMYAMFACMIVIAEVVSSVPAKYRDDLRRTAMESYPLLLDHVIKTNAEEHDARH